MMKLDYIYIYRHRDEFLHYEHTLGHTKLISCSTEHHGNEVGSVGRKENKFKDDVTSYYCFLL